MKKLLMVFLVLMASACANAESEVVDGVTWYYETHELFQGGNYAEVVAGAVKYAGDLTIPSSLGGNPVTQIGASAFHDCSELQSVIIPSSVTYIGWGAFSECRKLEVVKIPSSVTSIASSAFEGCVGIKSATIPACVSRMSVTFPDSYVTISEVVILDGVTTIGQYAFSNCQSLKSVRIPEGVLSIGENAFHYCHRLTSLTIPSSVTEIGNSAFSGCSKLVSVTLPLGVKNISQFTFSGCSGLKSVTIPPSVTRIEMLAFSGCEGLMEVHVSDISAWCGIEFECWEQSGSAEGPGVWMCANPLVDAHKLFVGENEVIDLQIPAGVTCISEAAFCGSDIKTVTIPASVECIGDGAFSGCKLLESVTISDGVKTIGDNAFSGCGRIASVLIPSSVTSVASSAFKCCDSLKHIEVEAGNTSYKVMNNCLVTVDGTTLVAIPFGCNEVAIPEGITEISEYTFEEDWNLKSVTIPSGVTTVGERAFSYCTGLKHVTIPKSVMSIGKGVFYGCAGLESVTISEGVKSIGASAFSGCKVLKSLEIPKSVTSIGWGAFSECHKLTSAAIPWGVASVEDYTFARCWALKSVTIPSSVTSIGAWAFWLCDGMTSVTIPASVKSIGSSAFGDCFSLEVIHVGKGGDIGEVKKVLHESGFDVNSVTFDYVDDPDRVDCKVVFNAQGGTAAWTEVTVPNGEAVGKLPVVTREGYEFLGWFTAAVGGAKVTADTVVTKDVTFYAHWKLDGTPVLHPGEKAEIDTGLVGYTASGLPSGLAYGKTTGKITGTATKPGEYIVKFTKSGAETEELTIIVTAIPTLKVAMEGDVDGCKVTGAGAYLVGKKVTLKVTTKKGTAFLGYYKGEEPWPNASDYKKTSLSYEMTRDDVSVVAKFEKEKMSVGCTGLEGYFVAGVAGSAEGIPLQIETQSGVKSVKVTKLPAGMKYDSKTRLITGAPTKAENPTVVIEVTAVSGAVEKKEISVRVIAPIEKAVGLFSGFATKDSLQDFNRVGTILLTTTAAGKLTAKVVTKKGSLSFSASSWDGIRDSQDQNDGVYFVTMKTKKGEELKLELDTRADVGIGANQLTGWLKGVDAEDLRIGAQYVVFGQPWYFTVSGDETQGWKLSYTADKKAAALTVTFKADGSVTIAGKLGTCKVSASGYANVSDLPSKLLRADFVVAVKVGSQNRMLNINTDLRFDRTYAPDEAGEAAFAE